MFTIASFAVPIGIGLILMLVSRRYIWTGYDGSPRDIHPLEFPVVALLIVAISLVITEAWGPQIARASKAAGYHEFWNGSITEAVADENICEYDGDCSHTYECDPYEELVYVPPTYDSKGNQVTPGYYYTVTYYHDCPYATKEVDYFLRDNIGRTLWFGEAYFEPNPVEWRRGSGLPGDVPRQPPARWAKSLRRLQNGDAEPVTKVNDYTNYILPSEDDSYKASASNVVEYKRKGLLPVHTRRLGDGVLTDHDMQAHKVQKVGDVRVPHLARWQDRLMRFNAALGIRRQGDLHIVLVGADKVGDPNAYVKAVKAYWQRDLDKWGFAKNGIALVLGIKGGKIRWARAETGMPVGNEDLLSATSEYLTGKPAKPAVVLGKVIANPFIENGEASVRYKTSDSGVFGNLVFKRYPFKRACMECNDKEEKGQKGYVFLEDSIPVTTGAKIVMFIVVMFISLGLWSAALYFDPFGRFTARRQPEEEREEQPIPDYLRDDWKGWRKK